MGCGKTTVGRLLAERMGLEFHDLDAEIEGRAGADIAWIFDVEGEAGFRDREAALLEELTERRGILLATGGGAVLREDNRRYLAARGRVIYLHADVDELLERTRKDRRRPLLAGIDRRATLTRLAAERDPLYRSVADLVVESNAGSPRALAERIRNMLEPPGHR